MKGTIALALLLAVPAARPADAGRPVTVRVEWVNYEQLHCQGCRIQEITMDAGAWYITAHKREEKMIYTKISGSWSGNAVRVTVTNEARGAQGTFADGESKSVVIPPEASSELQLDGIRFLLSAAAAPASAAPAWREADGRPATKP
jgi:hypothetical protein